MKHYLKHIAAAIAALCAASASAETLTVSGVYPASNGAAAAIGSIAIDRFGGADGQQLAIAIADRLRRVTIYGDSWFRIFPEGSLADAEAMLQGTATAEVSRRDSGSREEEVCIERDEDRDCIKRETQSIPCWDHVVRLDATVRLLGTEGELLDSFDRQEEQTQRYCQGDGRPSSEAIVRALATRYADSLRYDLAPLESTDEIRVMESRKGLAKADSRAFRDAIRLTKTDRAAACAAWAALEAANPAHIGVLFNLGLCAESSGQLDQAETYYRSATAAQGDDDYAVRGLGRIESRRRAYAQLERHRGS